MSSLRPLVLNRQIFSPALYSNIRKVWFGDLPNDTAVPPPEVLSRWYGGAPPDEKASFDKLCHTEFNRALDAIGPSKWPLPPVKSYEAEKQLSEEIAAPFLADCSTNLQSLGSATEASNNALSLILLLDQVPRNIFREDQAVIYNHYDRISRALLYSFLAKSRPDLDPAFRTLPAFRLWFYMPFMHSEFLEDHLENERILQSVLEDVKDASQEAKDYVAKNIEFEKKHVDIIKKFGRYPHRNDQLGRTSTKEEIDYIKNGGETFGTKGS